MELQIEYTRTIDGVKIATASIGSGLPLVIMPNVPWSHIRLEWILLPEARAWYEGLAARRRVILYDGRGGGLSDRDNLDFSLECQLHDLSAVLNHWKLRDYALLGVADSGPAAIAHAAAKPQGLTHLALWCAYSNVDVQDEMPEARAGYAAAQNVEDWDYFARMAANIGLGYVGGELTDRFAEWARNATSREALLAGWHEQLSYDVDDLLSEIEVPTLVVHRAGVASLSLTAAEALATAIPHATLEVLPGASWIPWACDTQLAIAAVYRFLGQDVVDSLRDGTAVRTVLFTDLVGHTEMMQRLGDERGREVLREHERITREVLRAHGGTEVKTMGDGFMASFGSVTKAVECAVALQKAIGEGQTANGERMGVRIGLNAGEPIEEDGDLFGAAVILASRIAANAEGGEILVADTVRGLCSGKGFLFSDRGEFVAKGFEEPVRVYEVRWGDG